MINILLNGYTGNMGKAFLSYIENSSDFKLMYGIDKNNIDLFEKINVKPDVIIDFSNPSATLACLDYAVKELVPVVIATTGFSKEDEDKIIEYSEAIPIFKSSNMSYGINLFSNIVASFAEKFKNINMDIEIIEKHHRKKMDAPSGTALMIADSINNKCDNKYKYVFNRFNYNSNKKIKNKQIKNSDLAIQNNFSNSDFSQFKSYNEIGFSSVRGGGLVGEHTVIFFGENESIELTHTAYSRNIYVEGSLSAAKFIITKKNGLYNMNSLI